MQGNKVTAKIGGNLNIETLQEKETYEEKNTSAGFDLSWDIRAGKFSKPTFGLSAGRGTIDSHYRSARGQSGIFAGKGGFDIYVEKNTDLKGAVIASEADAGEEPPQHRDVLFQRFGERCGLQLEKHRRRVSPLRQL